MPNSNTQYQTFTKRQHQISQKFQFVLNIELLQKSNSNMQHQIHTKFYLAYNIKLLQIIKLHHMSYYKTSDLTTTNFNMQWQTHVKS
jgi:hypothetical protein